MLHEWLDTKSPESQVRSVGGGEYGSEPVELIVLSNVPLPIQEATPYEGTGYQRSSMLLSLADLVLPVVWFRRSPLPPALT